MTNKPIAVSQILDDIEKMLREVDEILSKYPQLGSGHDIPEEQVELYIRSSFINTLDLLQRLNLNKRYDELYNVYLKAQEDKHGFLKKEWIDDTPYLVWPMELGRYLSKIKRSVSDKKKLRPNQKAKIKCREIAERIWSKDPTITIAAMIKHPEIRPHRTKRDGKLYVAKTIHNWIKEECPDPSPGRRRGT
jgi:hypothetical protein